MRFWLASGEATPLSPSPLWTHWLYIRIFYSLSNCALDYIPKTLRDILLPIVIWGGCDRFNRLPQLSL